jgi:hypothetical protein
MVSIYRYQDRPAGKFFLEFLKRNAKKRFTPPTANTCSNDYPITLAGQSMRTYENAPVSPSAGRGFLL